MRISKRKRVFFYSCIHIHVEELEGALYIIYLPIEILRNIRMHYGFGILFSYYHSLCHNRFI